MFWGSLLLFLKEHKKLAAAAAGGILLLIVILVLLLSGRTLAKIPHPGTFLGLTPQYMDNQDAQIMFFESTEDLGQPVAEYVELLENQYAFSAVQEDDAQGFITYTLKYTGFASPFAQRNQQQDIVIRYLNSSYQPEEGDPDVAIFYFYSPFAFQDYTPSSGSGSTPDTPQNTPSDDRTLVSEPLESDPLSYSITADSVYIQDPVEFCDGALTHTSSSSTGNYHVQQFTGSSSDKAVLAEYVQTICGGGYNLELTAQYDQAFSSNFFSWGIDYTGSGDVNAQTDVVFLDDTQANICVYGIIDGNDLEATFWIPQDMEMVDLGLRYGGGSETVSLAGESALAGLYKLSDGSFETTDGRLSVKPGQATVLRDGSPCTTEATFNRDSQLNRDELWVRNFYRDETLFFCAPENRLETGDVYTLKDLTQEAGWINSMAGVLNSADSFTDYNWTLFFGAGHDGDFITPLLSDLNEFKDLTVRVMYWNEGVEAVYYIYAAFDSSPHTVEALCAVDLSGGGSDEDGGSGDYLMYTGESLQITCPTKFDTNYELFRWEVVAGSSLASLSGSTSETCTIQANQAGTVRIRVRYTYGVEEPDVLTGIDRNVDRTDTHEYTVVIRDK